MSDDLVKRLIAFDYSADIQSFYEQDPDCVGEAASRIEELNFEIARLRKRLEQEMESLVKMGTKGQAIIDRLSADNTRLRTALENVLAHRYGDWTSIARAALEGKQ
jgi:hypothetical protein